MTRLAAVVLIGLALSGCQQEEVDVWCRSFKQDDLRFTRQTVNAMPPADKRKYAQLLEGAAALCRWSPQLGRP